MQRRYFSGLFLGLALAACHETPKPISGTSFYTGALTFRGHEDLTALAINQANRDIESKYGLSHFYPHAQEEEGAIFSDNPIIIGNFHTDFPDHEFALHFGMDLDVPDHFDSAEAFLKAAAAFESWHHADNLQHLHALRDHEEGGVPKDAGTTCRQVRQAITDATNLALPELKQNRESSAALGWIGHATHVIQDSFAPAHARRDESDHRLLRDFCTYGEEYPTICHHEENDPRDRIYKRPFCSVIVTEDCLLPEAKTASEATQSYLTWLADALIGDHPPGDSLDAWFDGAEGSVSGGYFKCDF